MKLVTKVAATIALGVVIAATAAVPSYAASMVEYAGHVNPNASMVEY